MKVNIVVLSALVSLPAAKGGSLRRLNSDPDAAFELDWLQETPTPAPKNDLFKIPAPNVQQSKFTTSRNNGNIEFTYLTAKELVLKYLQDPNGLVEFRNIQSSNHTCFALFSNGHSAGVRNETGEYLIPDSGIILSTGDPKNFNGQDSDEARTNFKISDGDEDLTSILPSVAAGNTNGGAGAIFDPCYLKFEFRCPEESDSFTPQVNFDYVFGSEEYNEYVFSRYNDAFGFFLNGNNIAYLPDGDTSVTINNVNYELNSEYFIENEIERIDENVRVSPYMLIEADGLTTELTAIAEPIPGWNEIKLVIGDVSDGILDSWVLLEAGTFGCKERTKAPTWSPTPQPSTTKPTKEPTDNPTSKPTEEPTPAPSTKPTKKPTMKPTLSPSVPPTSSPTKEPTAQPTNKPTRKPTEKPTVYPSFPPTSPPTVLPTSTPTRKPTRTPTSTPSASPSLSPTSLPTPLPSNNPTPKPTMRPTNPPSESPSASPTSSPSLPPSNFPSSSPSTSPTLKPTRTPTSTPSSSPSRSPTSSPAPLPTNNPTPKPTMWPTNAPSESPSASPTSSPSLPPSNLPSSSPSTSPTLKPTRRPTSTPSSSPSLSPTSSPTPLPSKNPTHKPTMRPTNAPSESPSAPPTFSPSFPPSNFPSSSPSTSPTAAPSQSPTTFSPTPKPTPFNSEDPTPNSNGSLTLSPPSNSPSRSRSEFPTRNYPCGLLPCDRSKGLREFYSTISDPSLFDVPGSPQSLALDWIINHDLMMVCPNDPNTNHNIQRYVLAVFYYATLGFQWASCKAPKAFSCEEEIENANDKCDRTVTPHFENTRIGINETNAWLTPAHECSWGGVACHGKDDPQLENCVDQIDFEANNLGGEIPQELINLTNLRFLYLEQGNMSGPIPSFLGSLSQLQVIDLDFNQFSGAIPKEIYRLSKLRQLDLDHNKLTGTISPEVALLTELNVLQLDHNSFEGTIPSDISQLKHLQVGFFSYNDFSGKIDQNICALREPKGTLEMLQVDCARENGKVECKCCSSCRQPNEMGERKLVIS